MEVLNRKPLVEDANEAALESAATPERQAQAEKMGWMPPARYKGEADRFVDAEEYIKRGETVLPIVKKQLENTRGELAAMRVVSAEQAKALKAATEAIADIEERHTVATQKAVERARADVKAQLEQASEAGDHAAVAQLTEQMTELAVAEKAAKDAPPPRKEEPSNVLKISPQDQAILDAWNADNPWFGKDKRRTALALGISEELREGGEPSKGRAFYDKVADEVERVFNAGKSTPVDKVESGRNGGDADSRQGGPRAKGFSSLPADAKAQCIADERQFVGAGKRYKTAAEWHTRYAEIYFQS